MSTRQYQNRNSQNDEYSSNDLDSLYNRLNRNTMESDTEADLARNLTHSIKALSRRWLQEAYLDGMMLADKLHQITSDTKSKLSSQQSTSQNNDKSTNNLITDQSIAVAVRQELQKLGLTNQNSKLTSNGSTGFGSFLFGTILLISGFLIVGGALNYYGLSSSLASTIFPNSNTQSQVANNNTNTTNQYLNQANPDISLPAVANLQSPANNTESPLPQSPALASPFSTNTVAANAQQLTTNNSNNNTANNLTNPTQTPTQTLPPSCNGQLPKLTRPLDIRNPDDRAIMYCILDLQAQQQQQQNPATTTQK